jgi:DNA-binding MarR family transcriptional regulator
MDSPTALDDLLCFSVYRVNLAFQRVYQPLLADLGLTYPQFLVMVALWERDDRSVGELGGALSLASSTLTPLLKRLEARGFVARARGRADERQVRVTLTPEGRAARERLAGLPACVFAATGLTAAEVSDLRTRLLALRGNLEGAAPPAE